jgi:hypothetical protein
MYEQVDSISAIDSFLLGASIQYFNVPLSHNETNWSTQREITTGNK